jgi:hypothetical protein
MYITRIEFSNHCTNDVVRDIIDMKQTTSNSNNTWLSIRKNKVQSDPLVLTAIIISPTNCNLSRHVIAEELLIVMLNNNRSLTPLFDNSSTYTSVLMFWPFYVDSLLVFVLFTFTTLKFIKQEVRSAYDDGRLYYANTICLICIVLVHSSKSLWENKSPEHIIIIPRNQFPLSP